MASDSSLVHAESLSLKGEVVAWKIWKQGCDVLIERCLSLSNGSADEMCFSTVLVPQTRSELTEFLQSDEHVKTAHAKFANLYHNWLRVSEILIFR
jgi:hypothetical protein